MSSVMPATDYELSGEALFTAERALEWPAALIARIEVDRQCITKLKAELANEQAESNLRYGKYEAAHSEKLKAWERNAELETCVREGRDLVRRLVPGAQCETEFPFMLEARRLVGDE